MGKWTNIDDTQERNIPATPGKYNSDPYYIGLLLLKNDEPTTITISDFTITKPDWVKDVSLGDKSSNGNYYPLTYEVEENTETSEREGYILITHNAANKTLKYIIKQAANTTQEPTEPTPTVYTFQSTNYESNNNYSLQVNEYNVDSESGGSFATINANDILSIDIKIASAAETSERPLIFHFIIIGDGFEFDSSIDNPRPTGDKLVDIIHNGKTKGELKISNHVSSGLDVHINIFSNNQDPKPSALLSEDTISEDVLSEDITGTIRINDTSVSIPFVVTFGFS